MVSLCPLSVVNNVGSSVDIFEKKKNMKLN